MTRNFAPEPPTAQEIAEIARRSLGCDIRNLQSLRGGAWSSVASFDCDAGPMVIRFSATGDDFRCDQLAAEFSSPALPIPNVRGIGQIDERWWCVSDRVAGAHLDELSAEDLMATLPSVATAFREMRAVDSTHTTGYGGWDDNGNGQFHSFAAQLMDVAVDVADVRGGGWSSRLAQHPAHRAVFDEGLRELESLCRYIPESRQLIHQDTLNFNVLVQDNAISCVIDWGCAMWGDGLFDLAWWQFWLPWYPQWSSVPVIEALIEHVGIEGPNDDERMRAYLIHIGIMHIRYNALIENWTAMAEVSDATAALLRRDS